MDASSFTEAAASRAQGSTRAFDEVPGVPGQALDESSQWSVPAHGDPVSSRGRRPIPPKLYRIGEVVDYSGMSRQTIHNYTTMGLLCESRWTAGGHRLYDEDVFKRLDMIAELKAQRKSLQYIREYFARLDGR